MTRKRKFSNCKLVSSSNKTIANKIGGPINITLNFTKGTAKLKSETITIKFDNLAEASIYGSELIVEFNDGSNIVLQPDQTQEQAPTEKKAEDPTKDEAVDREERTEERSKNETFETKERIETRAFMGLKLDPTMKKIIEDYSNQSDKIMKMIEDYLESFDNMSNAQVMVANKQARFYDNMNMILGGFIEDAGPKFFKLLSMEIDEEFKRRDEDKEEEEKRVKELRDKSVTLEKEVKKLEENRDKLEEEREDLKNRIKALRKREQELTEKTAVTPVKEDKEEDDD